MVDKRRAENEGEMVPYERPKSMLQVAMKSFSTARFGCKVEKTEPYVFLPNLNEVIGGRLRLRYCIVNDTYYRDYDDTINPKTTNTKTEWESVLHQIQGIQQYRDDIHDELYLDRKEKFQRGCISWKFDFTASGLVIDAIQVKIEVVRLDPGKVMLHLIGDNDNDKTVSRPLNEEVNNVKTMDLSGCKILTVKVLISAEKPGRFTKLFLQSTAGKKVDCPLDINIRLKYCVNAVQKSTKKTQYRRRDVQKLRHKRPFITVGRSLLLLGLLYTKEKLSDANKRNKQKKSSKDNGYLYLHIHQAKRLPLRISGTAPDPQVKCKLIINDKGISCKTARIRKTINPTWDEQYLYEGISASKLASARLEVQLTHDVRAFNRSKKKESLGCVNIRSLSWSETGSDDENGNDIDQGLSKKMQHRDSCDITCSRLSGSDRCVQKTTYEEDIIDIMLNGSSRDVSSTAFNEESNENNLNKHRSVSLTSLQSTAKGSIMDIDERDDDTWWSQARKKSFGKILGGFGLKQTEKRISNLKRPSIVLSNSQESVVVLGPDEDENDVIDDLNEFEEQPPERKERSKSWTNLLPFETINETRRGTLTPLVDSTVDTLIDPLAQIQDIAKLAASQWDQLGIHKDRWLYCWHPLSCVEI